MHIGLEGEGSALCGSYWNSCIFLLGAVLWPIWTKPGVCGLFSVGPSFSFGFLLENVIFNLLCEKKRIIVLLLLEGLLSAFEWTLALCTAAIHHDLWSTKSKTTTMEQVRDCQARDYCCYCSKGHLWSRYLSSLKKKNLKRAPNYLKKKRNVKS